MSRNRTILARWYWTPSRCRVFAHESCTSFITKPANSELSFSSADCCTGAVEVGLDGAGCEPDPSKSAKKFFPVSRLRTRRMIAPPQPTCGPRPKLNPPPLPRRSSTSDMLPGVQRMRTMLAIVVPGCDAYCASDLASARGLDARIVTSREGFAPQPPSNAAKEIPMKRWLILATLLLAATPLCAQSSITLWLSSQHNGGGDHFPASGPDVTVEFDN